MRPLRTRASVAAGGVIVLLAGPHVAASTTGSPMPSPTAVIAFVDESPGINLLHHDFATADGRDVVLPAGMPAHTVVSLPRTGSFAQRLAQLAAGPLGHLRPGVPVYVRGTRLIVVTAPGSTVPVTDVLAGDRLHATGVVDSAIGRRYGTAPAAIGLLVLGSAPSAYEWVASQPWVDLVSTSGYDLPQLQASSGAGPTAQLCVAAAAVHAITASGRVVFSSAGNTTDTAEQVSVPNGLPDVYQVGGVDRSGATYLPPNADEGDPFYAAGTTQRPYDTGELYSFPAASPDAFDGSVHFGGTSGATPRTAGWAADLLIEARRLLRATPNRTTRVGLAVRGRTGSRLPHGPLADGAFNGRELVDVLLHVAQPAAPATPARYFVEGYGALGSAPVSLGRRVLGGTTALPTRADEDSAYALVHRARAATEPVGC
ncbi:MAG: S8 family serine peptidase [Mycobacteriales bacterium]